MLCSPLRPLNAQWDNDNCSTIHYTELHENLVFYFLAVTVLWHILMNMGA